MPPTAISAICDIEKMLEESFLLHDAGSICLRLDCFYISAQLLPPSFVFASSIYAWRQHNSITFNLVCRFCNADKNGRFCPVHIFLYILRDDVDTSTRKHFSYSFQVLQY